MRRRSSAAFTLIEVMVATMILALFVASISTLISKAARDEGLARTKAAAGALADDEIAKLEEGSARGAAPPLGTGESRHDRFHVATQVRPFDAGELAPAAPRPPARGAPSPPPSTGFLTGAAARVNPPLLEIEVRVTWDDAPVDASGQPIAVRRLTYLLNPVALEALPKADGASGTGTKGAGTSGAATHGAAANGAQSDSPDSEE